MRLNIKLNEINGNVISGEVTKKEDEHSHDHSEHTHDDINVVQKTSSRTLMLGAAFIAIPTLFIVLIYLCLRLRKNGK
jgi:hypothetical protein